MSTHTTRPVSRSTDLAELAQLHRTFVAGRSGPLERSEAYWTRWVPSEVQTLPLAGKTYCACVVAVDESQHVVAYLIVHAVPTAPKVDYLPQQTVRVMELVWSHALVDRANVLAALWTAAMGACHTEEPTVYVRALAETMNVLAAALPAPVGPGAARPPVVSCHRGHMVHALNPAGTVADSTRLAEQISADGFLWFATDGF